MKTNLENNFYPKNKRELLSLGIILSLGWAGLASYIYFDQVVHYPKSYIEYFNLGLSKYFKWEEDSNRRDKALAYAKSNGNEARAKFFINMGLKFLKPAYSAIGYFSLMLIPILFIWLLVYAINRIKIGWFSIIALIVASIIFFIAADLLALLYIYTPIHIGILFLWYSSTKNCSCHFA